MGKYVGIRNGLVAGRSFYLGRYALSSLDVPVSPSSFVSRSYHGQALRRSDLGDAVWRAYSNVATASDVSMLASIQGINSTDYPDTGAPWVSLEEHLQDGNPVVRKIDDFDPFDWIRLSINLQAAGASSTYVRAELWGNAAVFHIFDGIGSAVDRGVNVIDTDLFLDLAEDRIE